VYWHAVLPGSSCILMLVPNNFNEISIVKDLSQPTKHAKKLLTQVF